MPQGALAQNGTKTKTRRKTQQRTVQTKDAILEAALLEFADHGYEGASLRRIGEQAGINHRLIQHHFGCKEMLWQATARHVLGQLERRLSDRAKGLAGVREAEFLRLIFREFVLFSAECPALNRFMLQANYSPERMDWFIDNILNASELAPLTLIARAQKAGIFIAGDPARLHYLFIGAATSIFAFGTEFKQVTGHDPYDEQIINEHIDMLESIFMKATANSEGTS